MHVSQFGIIGATSSLPAKIKILSALLLIVSVIIHYEKYLGISIEHCPGVYRPAEDTFLLLDHLIPGNRVLEIGCGTGIISIYCARMGRNVTCCDISQGALDCAEKNAIRNRVSLNIVNSNLFQNIEGAYDTIIFNPPYLPVEDRFENAEQWNGGSDGFDIIAPFLDSADRYLEDSGSIYIILSSLTDLVSLQNRYKKYTFKEKAKESYFFETLFLFQLFKAVHQD